LRLYAESSAVLAWLLGDERGESARRSLADAEVVVSSDLTLVDQFRVPKSEAILDGDFGGSPTLFQAVLPGDTTPTQLVGACNKNGIYYVLRQSSFAAGTVWKFRAGIPDSPIEGQCDAAAVWDGSRLFVASNATTINGTDYLGSVRQMDPTTGTPVWETGLAGPIIGTPMMNGNGVIAATSWGANQAQDGLWMAIKIRDNEITRGISHSGITPFTIVPSKVRDTPRAFFRFQSSTRSM